MAEGVLTKACRTGVKPRQFFLFNDLLVCTVQRRYYLHIYLYLQTRYLQTVYVQVYGTILVRGHKYTRQHVLPLHELSVRLLAEGEGEVTTRVNTAVNNCHVSTLQVDHGWVVNTRTKSFAVYAATRAEKQGWIEAINKVTRGATC